MLSQMVTPPYWPERDGPLALAQAKNAGAHPKDQTVGLYPARRNPAFTLDRPLTDEKVAAEYNNFYEFGGNKAISWLAKRMETRPWQVEVKGHVKKPKTYDIDELIKSMTLEERLYRFRCVEAWAMAVPWTGFKISELIKKVEPTSKAKYIKFTTFLNRKVALGQLQVWYPWPYVEGLTMKEAMNELAMMGTGIYGHPMPQQHGAPLRLVIPWKFGFKNIKSIVSIEFTDKRPRTFWEKAAPQRIRLLGQHQPEIQSPQVVPGHRANAGNEREKADAPVQRLCKVGGGHVSGHERPEVFHVSLSFREKTIFRPHRGQEDGFFFVQGQECVRERGFEALLDREMILNI